ncbi:MAG: hypothetical protein M1511_13065 [Deltaproteobacteria bacterium]|nr:hypothetical protein [Deltaproteobacteria bacterium]
MGGGQEVIEIDGKKFTRLYAGGTIALEELAELGLTKKDVIRYLKSKLKELGNRTRLLENCRVEDGDWDYDYFLLDVDSDIPLTTAQEMIRFRGKRFFVHSFLLCPIE